MRVPRTVAGVLLLLIGLGIAAGALLHPGPRGPVLRVVTLGRVQAGGAWSVSMSGSLAEESLQRQRIVVDARAGRVYVAPSPNGYDSLSGVPTSEAAVFTFSTTSGALLTRTALHGAAATLAPDVPAGRVLFLEQGLSAVGVLDAVTGRLHGAILLPYMPAALAVDERTGWAYTVGGLTPTMSIIDVHDQHVLGAVSLGIGQPEWVAADGRDGTVIVGSLVVGVAGAVTTRLYMVSARSGRLLHTLIVPSAALVPVLDSRRGRLYVVRDGDLLVIDARRDALLRVIRVASSLSAAPRALTNGSLEHWQLPRLAVDARTGHVLLAAPWQRGAWLVNDRGVRARLPTRPSWSFNQIGTNDARGQFVLSDERHILVLDARTGAVARSIPLRMGDDIAVDGNSDHAFALSMESRRIVPADPWGWLPGGLRAHLPFLPPRPAPYDTLGTVTAIDLSR